MAVLVLVAVWRRESVIVVTPSKRRNLTPSDTCLTRGGTRAKSTHRYWGLRSIEDVPIPIPHGRIEDQIWRKGRNGYTSPTIEVIDSTVGGGYELISKTVESWRSLFDSTYLGNSGHA